MITCKPFVCCGIGEKREGTESGKPSKVIADQEESGKVKSLRCNTGTRGTQQD
jgi:hypothetical protein